MPTKATEIKTMQNENTFFDRHGWKILSGAILLIGLFGVGDMFGGASDLQNGESGSVLFVISAAVLLLSNRKFMGHSANREK